MITGSNGQLGRELQKFYSQNSNIELLCSDINELDISNKSSVNSYITINKPDIIINAAAYTQVDKCEDEKEIARKINVDGTKNLVDAIKKTDIVLVHVSTDYVFNGEKKEAYISPA